MPKQEIANWVLQLMEYSAGVQWLMEKAESGEAVNLSAKVFREINQSRTFGQLADYARLRYEGTLDNSRIFASKFIKRHLSALFLPFRYFLMQFDIATPVRYNHEGNFELCCFRRLQEMFPPKENPNEIPTPGSRFPMCFGNSTFGLINNFWLHQSFIRFPKITTKGAKRFESLDQKTASEALLPQIVAAMRSQPLPCNFLPADLSASSDSFLLSKATLNNEDRTVTIGLAVKCLQTPLSHTGERNSLKREQFVFNRMFDGVPSPDSIDAQDRNPRYSGLNDLGKDINILIVISTGGFSDMHFGDGSYSKTLVHNNEFPNITETILIDLSSVEKRKDFFGVTDDEDLTNKIEWMVSKGTTGK